MQLVLNEPEISVKEPYAVRWMGLRNAVQAVHDCYPSILATLSALAADKNSTALGLHKYFAMYKVTLVIAFMADVHNVIGKLSCQLQKQDILFSEIQPLILDAARAQLDHFKNHDGECLTDMKSTYEITDNKVNLKGEMLSHYNVDMDKQFKSLKNITNLQSNIKLRFQKEDSKLFTFLSLLVEPCTGTSTNSEDSEISDALKNVAKIYGTQKITKVVHGHLQEDEDLQEEVTIIPPLLDGTKLKQEWPMIKGMINGAYSKLDTAYLCRKIIMLHSELVPNFSKLCCIALCISVTSVECERVFSCQNRFKSKFRASLSPEKLDILNYSQWTFVDGI